MSFSDTNLSVCKLPTLTVHVKAASREFVISIYHIRTVAQTVDALEKAL